MTSSKASAHPKIKSKVKSNSAQSLIFSLSFSLLLMTLFSLSACGGSSSSENTSTGSQDFTSQKIIAFDDEVNIGQPVGLFLYYPDDELSSISWQQTSGPAISILTPTSKGISFTPTASGTYSFEAHFTVNSLQTILSHSVSVTNNTTLLSAYLDHMVQEGNDVSLRVGVDSSLSSQAITNITWTQLSGTTVTFTDPLDADATTTGYGDLVVYFQAPNVGEDTLLEFEVTTEIDNEVYRDNVGILIENAESISNSAYFDERVASVYPYITDAPYHDNLAACTYDNSLSSSCTFAALPLLAQQTLTPTIDDIMERVVVSHPWMAERLEDFLTLHDSNGDFKNLLRATTAIVISYDIRPSFYWAATGAIYLDPDNLWLSAEERDTINESPDYRSDYGSDLAFVMPWRYVKDNDYAYYSQDITLREDRSLDDIVYRLSRLLYHELAHANDFLSATEWALYDDNVRMLDAALSNDEESDELTSAYPLVSTEMNNLAQVSFLGDNATNTQQSYLPSDIASFFATDSANDYYNYSSTREDLAMLFEEFMMQTRFSVQRDVAITNLPEGDDVTGSDYIVEWGERGRIGDNDIIPRIDFVLKRILPSISSSERESLLNDLPTPLSMVQGDDWYENLVLTTLSSAINPQNITLSKTLNPPPQTTRYHHKALPK